MTFSASLDSCPYRQTKVLQTGGTIVELLTTSGGARSSRRRRRREGSCCAAASEDGRMEDGHNYYCSI
jgi:hypothetical protein